MTYYVIYGTEDGAQVEPCKDEAELREFLDDNGYKFFRTDFKEEAVYWADTTCAIIKGEIIKPQAKKVVKEWDFGENQ
jgi:hypothetical protein